MQWIKIHEIKRRNSTIHFTNNIRDMAPLNCCIAIIEFNNVSIATLIIQDHSRYVTFEHVYFALLCNYWYEIKFTRNSLLLRLDVTLPRSMYYKEDDDSNSSYIVRRKRYLQLDANNRLFCAEILSYIIIRK